MSNAADIERLWTQQKNEIKVLLNQLKEDLKTELMVDIENIVQPIKNDVADLKNNVADLKNDVADLKNNVADLKNDVADLKNNVEVLDAMMRNSSAARDDNLVRVPRRDGQPLTGDFPETLMHLLVAGNEALPNGQRNNWDKSKSHHLLGQYLEEDDDVSDNENEYSERARVARLRLARALGVTRAQLNYAQLSL